MTLSDTLVNQLHEAIQSSEAPDHYWHYNEDLSVEQINTILALPNGFEAAEREIISDTAEALYDTERDHIIAILKKFKLQIQQELEDDSFGTTDADWNDLIEEYSLLGNSPGVNANIMDLVSNTRRPRVVIQFDLYQEYGWRWRKYIKYEDVKDLLHLLNINPRHIHKSFPYHGRRKGIPSMSPKHLISLWDNAPEYGGRYAMPVSIKLKDFIENSDHYHTGIIIQKGSKMWLHNYGEGSGSISVPLQKNLKILKERLSYTFGDDRETTGYGLDEVYGLCDDAWNNYIKPVKTRHPKPYEITPVETLVKGIGYVHSFSKIHYRWEIRPYHKTEACYGNKPNKPGHLMEWDLNNLCKNFPEAAKDYLRKKADRDAIHYAYKIREIMGQVEIIYGYMVVNYFTGEIVWRHTKSDERTSALFTLIESRLKQLHAARKKAA